LTIGRPVSAQEGRTATLFKLVGDGSAAVRTQVELGRASATAIEVRKGLEAGDQVLISDTSAYEKYERIKLR